MRMAEMLKTNMAKKTRKTHLIRFEWSSEMIEDPIDASQNHKAIWFDFNANKFKPYEEIRKSLARKYKEESFLEQNRYQKNHMRVFLLGFLQMKAK